MIARLPTTSCTAAAVLVLAATSASSQQTTAAGGDAEPAVTDDWRGRAHGRDERIRIDHLHEGQEFLYRLVKALAGAD